MGMEVHLAGPKTLMPRFLFEEPGIVIHDRIEEAIEAADVINVLRIQLERQKSGLFPSPREYARIFGVNDERLKLAKDDVLIMHPGPMNKGLEISPYVAYGDHSAIQEQVQNGVAVRMALLTLALTGGKDSEADS
jgi:aspartate carbamoyltransferase catalytic subunit